MLKKLFENTKNTLISEPKPLVRNSDRCDRPSALTSAIGSLFIRAGSSTGEVVLCFRVGGWWPVVIGLIAGDA